MRHEAWGHESYFNDGGRWQVSGVTVYHVNLVVRELIIF